MQPVIVRRIGGSRVIVVSKMLPPDWEFIEYEVKKVSKDNNKLVVEINKIR